MGESWGATEYSNHGGTCWVMRDEAEAKLSAARAEAAAERERADGWEGLARDYARRLGERVASPLTTEMLKFNGIFAHPADPETGEETPDAQH